MIGIDVALTAGFADQAHFTRMFRSSFGVTPGRYAGLHSTEAGRALPIVGTVAGFASFR